MYKPDVWCLWCLVLPVLHLFISLSCCVFPFLISTSLLFSFNLTQFLCFLSASCRCCSLPPENQIKLNSRDTEWCECDSASTFTLLFHKCLLSWAALLDRHIPTSSAIAATILEIVTELHFILDSFSEVVWFVNSIFGRLCIRWSNSHYVTVRLNKPGALCLVLLRECFPPLDEQTYTYSDVRFTRIQKCPINTPIPSSADVSEEISTYTYVSFSLPLFPAPLFSHTELSWKILVWNCRNSFVYFASFYTVFLLTAILLSQGSDLESRWVVWLLLLVQTSKSWYHSSRGARPTASTRHLKICR